MKAIETRWKGYRFRSRTEARWAVFLDTLGLKFDYEPEGLILKSGPYLPDFRISGFSIPDGETAVPVWLEVKGAKATLEELRKCADLCFETQELVLLAEGPPEAEREDIHFFNPAWGDPQEIWLQSLAHLGVTITSGFGGSDRPPELCVTRNSFELPPIESFPEKHHDFHRRLQNYKNTLCFCLGSRTGERYIEDDWIGFSAGLRKAYDRARSARFEFGESDQRWS